MPTNHGDSPRYKRRKKLIQPGLQFRLILTFLSTGVAALCIQGLYLLHAVSQTSANLPTSQPGRVAEILANEVWVGVGISLAILIPLTLVIGTLVTFRVAGPAYRLEQHLLAIARGEDPGICRLRKGDELQSICSALNGAVARLRSSATATPAAPTEAELYAAGSCEPEASDTDHEADPIAESQSGFTLLEIAVTVGMGSLFTIGLLTAFVRIQNAHAENQSLHELEMRAQRTMDQLVYQTRQAVSDAPNFGGLSNVSGNDFRGLRFSPIQSFSSGSPVYDTTNMVHLIGGINGASDGVILGRGRTVDSIAAAAGGTDGRLGTNDDQTVLNNNGDRVAETLLPSRHQPQTGERLTFTIVGTMITITLRMNELETDGAFRFPEDLTLVERVALRQ